MIGGARLSFAVGCHRLVEAEVSCYNRAWHRLPSQTRDYMAPLDRRLGATGDAAPKAPRAPKGSTRSHRSMPSFHRYMGVHIGHIFQLNVYSVHS